MEKNNGNAVYTQDEIAELLEISQPVVYTLASRGCLPIISTRRKSSKREQRVFDKQKCLEMKPFYSMKRFELLKEIMKLKNLT